jgi:hypothetical protein
MKRLLIASLLCLPAAAYSQELSKAELEDAAEAKAGRTEALESSGPVQRPDSRKIMAELSAALRLSSKQEERISSAVNKQTGAFDKLMREYEKNTAEEKKWRYKMNESRFGMVKINRELPEIIREFLDDDQRQSYDEMLIADRKPAAPAAIEQAAEGEDAAPRPVKKKRLVKRKKLPAGKAPAAALADDEAGQTMVDKEITPAPKKMKRVLKKKSAPKAEAVEEAPAAEEEAAGAKPTGKEAPAEEEDAGSYP